MRLIEEKGDLFELMNTHLLVHCISRDCKMGSGIALQFRNYYPNMANDIKNYLITSNTDKRCILYGDRVANLITKERYFHLPDYSNLEQSLIELRQIIIKKRFTRIAMPTIGCGLDMLSWNKVRKIIQNIFNDLNIDIIVRLK